MDPTREIAEAELRIRPHIRRTYLVPSPYFSRLSGANVFFKCENLQHTGSFKVRGALNKLLSLSKQGRERGVVTASTGNHGAGVAFAARRTGTQCIVFVPENAAASKVESIELLGGTVRYTGRDCVEAEAAGRSHAERNALTYVSPYNDPQVIGGQGTVGAEICEQLERVDAVFVALGGGGLIGGIAAHLKHARPGVEVVGCSPENSQVMIESVRAGRILDLPSLPTLSDGTAGGIEPGSITFALCRNLVDKYVAVTEDAIRTNLREFLRSHHLLIEGAAAVPIAALLRIRGQFANKNVVIVLCGANIDPDVLGSVLQPEENS
jgi:threonine dehydratase